MKTGIIKYITSLESGGRPKGGGTSDGDIPSFGAEHLNSDGSLNLNNLKYIPFNFYENLNKGRIKKNDILIVKDGATTGKVSYVNGVFPYKDAAINEHVFLLRVDVEKVYPKYLFYHLYSDFGKNQILSDFRGSTVGGISRGFVEYINLPLPDIKTQKEIAQVLEQADKARQQRKAANALTDQFLQSSFLSLFGDPVKNEKGWEKMKLEDVCSKITDGKHGDCKDESNSGYYFISAKDLVDGTINYNDVREITKEDFDETDRRTRLQINDVLIGNTGASIGKIGIAKDLQRTRRTTFQKSIAIVTTDSKIFLPDFLMAYFLANNTILEKISSGSGQKNLLLSQLRNYEMIIPPLSLQQQFADIVAQAEQLRQKQRESERELENLFQGLLQRYFG